jgi:hypothetical protein
VDRIGERGYGIERDVEEIDRGMWEGTISYHRISLETVWEIDSMGRKKTYEGNGEGKQHATDTKNIGKYEKRNVEHVVVLIINSN